MNDLDSLLADLGINPENTEENNSDIMVASATDADNNNWHSLSPADERLGSAQRAIQEGNGLLDQIQRIQAYNIGDMSLEHIEDITRQVFEETGVPHHIEEPSLTQDIQEETTSDIGPVTSEEVDELIGDTRNINNLEIELKPITIHNDDSARFSGAEWFDEIKNKGVAVIGLGGIGSWLSLLLSRLKVRYMYGRDMDKVETINLAGQLYEVQDIGRYKTEATRNIINKFNRMRPSVYMDTTEFTATSAIPSISSTTPMKNVMLCLDSITARRTVYEYWKSTVANEQREFILIDGRLTADKWQIFAIPSKDTKRMEVYEKEWLFPQSEAQHLPCSFKQTTYMAAMIASYMCNLFVNFVAESTKPLVPYNIPFMIEFDAQTLEFKTYECT